MTEKWFVLKLFLIFVVFSVSQLKGQETENVVCSKTIWGGPAGKNFYK